MKQAPSIELPIQTTLEDLYIGKSFEILHRKQDLCSKCRGSGAEKPDDVKKCTTCGGSGYILQRQQLAPGFVTQTQTM